MSSWSVASSDTVEEREKDDSEDTMKDCDVTTQSSRTGKLNIWDDQEEKALHQIILSVVFGGGQLGLTYYAADSTQLFIMPDVAEAQDLELLKRVLMEIEPSIILTTSKQDEIMKQVLTNYAESDVTSNMHKVEVLPSTEFKFEACRRRILSLYSFPGVSVEATDEERMIRISSVIPLESVNMVRSLGALMKYLDKNRVGIELEEFGTKIPILSIKRFTLDKLVQMDETAYSSLQIFRRESHPSVYKVGTGSKEGLSMFGIANHTRSPLGNKLLRLWFLRPLCDMGTLRQRQDAVGFLCNPKHIDIMSSLSDCLKSIKNVPRILARMNASQASIADWQSLYKTAYNAICIGDICHSLPQNIDVFKKISAQFSDDLPRVATLINKIVDFDESISQNRFVVKFGVDSGLDEKKQIYNGLPDLMTKVASSELQKLDDEVQECQVIYLPQVIAESEMSEWLSHLATWREHLELGYLLRFHRTSWMKTEKHFQVDGMDFVFLSEDFVHYKTTATKELDQLLGDTQCEINDCETAIMHRLQSVIVEYTESLLTVVECSAELDCLISLAYLAKESNYTKPDLTEDNAIYIKAGRHPLQEMCVSPFVPNDTCLDLSNGRMKLLTGPNASGKSVYLKQVGLIVYLAHIGSFVPAEAAKIGLMDGIFTRIQTRESVSVGQSAFLIDLNQVALAVNNSTSRCLVLLDEFGKGTATVDGLSLLTAVLRHWLAKGESCPNIIVSTHFHSVVQQKLLPNTKLIEYLTMQTINQEEELVFLYQLTQGTCDTSYAGHIANLVGLPQEIIKRGAQVSDFIRQNEPIPKLEQGDVESRNKACAIIVSRFLDLDLDHADIGLFLKDFVKPTAEGVI